MSNIKIRKRVRLGVFIAASGLLGLSVQQALAAPPSSYLPDNLPPVYGLEKYIKNKDVAIQLGKAFFWDMQAGSQGQSCASCHFAAGADNRSKNQISPGILHTDPAMQDKFNYDGYPTMPSGGKGGPNYQLTKEDFPLYRLSEPEDRDSYIEYETDDVISSQGVSFAKYVDLSGNNYQPEFDDGKEKCENIKDIFHINNKNTRRVEPRNAPTVINTIYNYRNFWDGRANNVFNGFDPFGPRSKEGYVLYYDKKYGKTKPEKTHLINSSLASLAVGPPGSNFEMTCDGKPFKAMARKLLRLQPLGLQDVHPKDSALGPLSAYPGKGLRTDYRKLIMEAFNDAYWVAPHPTADGYSQMEHNFPLFWGLAIQMYESTLVSLGESKFEKNTDLTQLEKDGRNVFFGFGPQGGRCAGCHSGPAFSGATLYLNDPEGAVTGPIFVGPKDPIFFPPGAINETAFADVGYMNIGVRPTKEDLGLGGTMGGYPLSFTRQAQMMYEGKDVPDAHDIGAPIEPTARTAVDGAFKIPLLHNIELTGPYMHNGGMATLEEVVEFYNRGGNSRIINESPLTDSTGHDGTKSNLAFNLPPLGLTDYSKKALVAFLKSLTDERVRWEKAPFDHPQLYVPLGHVGDEYSVQDDGTGRALAQWFEIPAIGAYGRSAENKPPIKGFLEETTYAPKANDDTASVKYHQVVTINLVSNDNVGSAPIIPSSLSIVTEPNFRDGTLTNNGDGTVTYRPMRLNDTSFTYQVKDENGLLSNVANVTVSVIN